MPRICYVENRFTGKTRATIAQVNEIIEEYQGQGFALTVRQLHYQFVARGWYENTPRNYQRLIYICGVGRLGGVIDWDAIEDRTRGLEAVSHWDDPAEIIESAADSYRIDKWESQPCRVEVWFEKAALAGIFDRVCKDLDVAYLACIGFNSLTEMHEGALRLRRHAETGQECIILQFCDHDPAGLEMTDDLRKRLATFRCDGRVEVRRLALNMDQVRQYRPPPSFIKKKDKLKQKYRARFGTEDTWELDALDPAVLADLVKTEIQSVLDEEQWEESVKAENEGRRLLETASKRWEDVEAFLEDGD
jgi:hypothetical protein